MSEEQKSVVAKPTDKLKQVMSQPSVREQFSNALGDNSGLFVSSLIDLYASDSYLQQCNPSKVVMEALKAATLQLPINKSLGFAYVIPYKNKQGQQEPQFQLGYKGLIQLAQRSGKYRYINAGPVYDGQIKSHDYLTGELTLGPPTGPETIGYFAMIETINGFRKVVYWTKEQVESHAKRFSKAYNSSYSPWKTDFDAMATKTLLKHLLSKYGIMSIEMANVMEQDNDTLDAQVQADIDENANDDFVDIEQAPPEAGPEDAPGEAAAPEEPTKEQVQEGIAKKLKALQGIDDPLFQEAKQKAGVPKTKPFAEFTEAQYEKLSGIFNQLVSAKDSQGDGPDY